MTLTEENGVWVFRVPEQGKYGCAVRNIVESGSHDGKYYFSGLSGIPKDGDHQDLHLNAVEVGGKVHHGAIRFSHLRSNDDNTYTGERESDVLTIGSRKFKMIVIDDETPLPDPFISNTLGKKITTCPSASTHPAPDMTLTEENGVWVFRVPEQGKYGCAVRNIVESGSHDGKYYFSGLSGIPKSADHQDLHLNAVEAGGKVHHGAIRFSHIRSNDDNTYTGDRESSVLTIGSRKFKMIVIEDDTMGIRVSRPVVSPERTTKPRMPFSSKMGTRGRYSSGNRAATTAQSTISPRPATTATTTFRIYQGYPRTIATSPSTSTAQQGRSVSRTTMMTRILEGGRPASSPSAAGNLNWL